ncbi:MAG TPA: hypothetical protein VJB87_05060, partial [Candidatus Nanoarchaeia archaeon]|nr:hypothetical protein [Candidatus Nanoarchaeia archaeon]
MTENEEENKQSDKKRKKVTILSGIQKENVTEDEESKSERTTVRTPIRTYVHTHIHTHQDSKEKSKKMLLGDIPSHLLEAFKKVREEAEKEGTYLDFDIFLTQLREKAEKEEELARFLESKRDSYRLIYLLKHIKIGHFTEIKEALGISENKTLIRLIRQLGIRLKSADNLRFDVRYKQRVLKKIIRQDTKSYYELGSLTKEELEGAEHFISEGFRRQVEEKKTTFEQATKEFDAYEIAELKRIEEKEKPLLDIVWGYVN